MPPTKQLIAPLFRGRQTIFNNSFRHVVQPHPIPNLQVMNELEQQARDLLSHSQLKPQETAIVGALHLLDTTSTLFQKIRNLGFEAYVTGKCYSTSPAVYEALKSIGVHVWPGSKPTRLGEYQDAFEKDIASILQEVETNAAIKNIVFLDSDDCFLSRISPHFRKKYRIGIVEQTRKIYSKGHGTEEIFTVNMAQCAANVLLANPLAVNEATDKVYQIAEKLDRKRCVIGVTGFGLVGRTLVDKLIKNGFYVAIFDKNPETYKKYHLITQVEVMTSIEQIFMHTDFIICTGQDITESFNPLTLNGWDRTLVTLTPEDRGFRQLLKTIAKSSAIIKIDPLSTIECYTNNRVNSLKIIYGGFPANFADSSIDPFNISATSSVLTQGLLFSSILQSLELIGKKSPSFIAETHTNVMLDPVIQQKVVGMWYRSMGSDDLPHSLIQEFLGDLAWISQNSKGVHYTSEISKAICKPPSSKEMKFKANL